MKVKKTDDIIDLKDAFDRNVEGFQKTLGHTRGSSAFKSALNRLVIMAEQAYQANDFDGINKARRALIKLQKEMVKEFWGKRNNSSEFHFYTEPTEKDLVSYEETVRVYKKYGKKPPTRESHERLQKEIKRRIKERPKTGGIFDKLNSSKRTDDNRSNVLSNSKRILDLAKKFSSKIRPKDHELIRELESGIKSVEKHGLKEDHQIDALAMRAVKVMNLLKGIQNKPTLNEKGGDMERNKKKEKEPKLNQGMMTQQYMDKRKNAWKEKKDGPSTNKSVDKLFSQFGSFFK